MAKDTASKIRSLSSSQGAAFGVLFATGRKDLAKAILKHGTLANAYKAGAISYKGRKAATASASRGGGGGSQASGSGSGG